MCNNNASEQAAAHNRMLRNKCDQAADAWGISRVSPLYADFCDHVLQDKISPKQSVYNLLKWWWYQDFLETFQFIDDEDCPHVLSNYSKSKLSAMLAVDGVTQEQIRLAAENLARKQAMRQKRLRGKLVQ